MKKIDFLPVHIALLTVPLMLAIWQANVGLRILNSSRVDTGFLSRLDAVQRGLASGAIKVDPPKHTKLFSAAVREWSGRIRDDRTEYDPYIELTQILLEISIGTLVLQLVVATGVPLWRRWRDHETQPSGSDARPGLG